MSNNLDFIHWQGPQNIFNTGPIDDCIGVIVADVAPFTAHLPDYFNIYNGAWWQIYRAGLIEFYNANLLGDDSDCLNKPNAVNGPS